MGNWWDSAVQGVESTVSDVGNDIKTGNVPHLLSDAGLGVIGGNVLNKAWDLVTSPHQAATAETPSTTQPTIQDANTTAINQQLDSERRQAGTGSLQNIGGGGGLLDQPTTSSRVLLGS